MHDYDIIYKPHIRNGYVRVHADGKLQLTIPSRLKHDEKFKQSLLQKGEILLRRYSKRKQIQTSGLDFVMLFGELVPRSDLPEIKKLPKYLKETLYEYSLPLIEKYASAVGHVCRKLNIRKTSSQRGSCTTGQHISLNVNLVHLPTQFIKYVIIHEVAHLAHKNHGPTFRATVEKFCQNHKLIRKELKNYLFT